MTLPNSQGKLAVARKQPAHYTALHRRGHFTLGHMLLPPVFPTPQRSTSKLTPGF